MAQTRSQALKEAELKVRYLNAELDKAQKLNLKLLSEQDECVEQYKQLIDQNDSLKYQLVNSEKELAYANDNVARMSEILEKNLENISLYDETLMTLRIYEKKSDEFDNLLHEKESEYITKMEVLTKENDVLKLEISSLQSQITSQQLTTYNSNRTKLNRVLLEPTVPRLCMTKKLPTIMGEKLFNKLPAHIQSLNNDQQFCNSVKQLLLDQTLYSFKEYFENDYSQLAIDSNLA